MTKTKRFDFFFVVVWRNKKKSILNAPRFKIHRCNPLSPGFFIEILNFENKRRNENCFLQKNEKNQKCSAKFKIIFFFFLQITKKPCDFWIFVCNLSMFRGVSHPLICLFQKWRRMCVKKKNWMKTKSFVGQKKNEAFDEEQKKKILLMVLSNIHEFDVFGGLLFTVLFYLFCIRSVTWIHGNKQKKVWKWWKTKINIMMFLEHKLWKNFYFFFFFAFPCCSWYHGLSFYVKKNILIKLSTYIGISTLVSTWTFECNVFMASLMYNERTD